MDHGNRRLPQRSLPVSACDQRMTFVIVFSSLIELFDRFRAQTRLPGLCLEPSLSKTARPIRVSRSCPDQATVSRQRAERIGHVRNFACCGGQLDPAVRRARLGGSKRGIIHVHQEQGARRRGDADPGQRRRRSGCAHRRDGQRRPRRRAAPPASTCSATSSAATSRRTSRLTCCGRATRSASRSSCSGRRTSTRRWTGPSPSRAWCPTFAAAAWCQLRRRLHYGCVPALR